MPYFIKPSINLESSAKEEAYRNLLAMIEATIRPRDQLISKMATINCLIKTIIPYAYWCGFYLMHEGALIVGPYQGTLGCTDIALGRGVCGRSAQLRKTIIVLDTHALQEGSDHITCDPNSRSEIVVPVFDHAGELIGVLDIDSTLESSFDEVDQHWLEEVVRMVF